MNNIYSTIIDILERKGPVPGDAEKEKIKYRYLDAGHVDSINLIQFILEIEEQFGIELTPQDTVSDRFRTVEGLIQIVEQKLKQESNQ